MENQANIIVIDQETSNKFRILIGSIGFAAGVIYGFKNHTGFWKGWGCAIVGGIVGSGIGYGIDQFSKK